MGSTATATTTAPPSTASGTSATAPPAEGNVSSSVQRLIGRNLHRRPAHPVCIIKDLIHQHFNATFTQPAPASTGSTGRRTPVFTLIDDRPPQVTVKQNFDELLIPADHVSRRPSDTFYLNPQSVLRTHTSAHQTELMRANQHAFLVVGDCYRRDEIDATHYPVFHQMEGVRVFSPDHIAGNDTDACVKDLKSTLEGAVHALFGNKIKDVRWIDAYFPFTHPSFEMEVMYNDKWLELLGCGAIHPQILANCGLGDRTGWAFGVGLERLAMVLFNIPDIRLFWSDDPRFVSQFTPGKITEFKSFSKYPPVYKDVTFFLPPNFHENDLCSLVRDVAGDMVERVQEMDAFVHPVTKQASKCYRITYRSMERSLTNKEIDVMQEQIRALMVSSLGVQLR